MKERIRKTLIALIFVLLLFAVSITVFADPSGPGVYDTLGSTRRNVSIIPMQLEAEAGNITALSINHTRVSSVWQGYYGNISGEIVLDNLGNYTMYSWNTVSSSGEILATRNSGAVTWSAINCSNQTHVETEESNLNIIANDVDGVNETFNDASHPEFTVGSVTFTTDYCDFTTNTYSDDTPGADFDEILLYENGYVIYTTLIEDGATGFDGSAADFQIIVGEDGHSGDTSSTTYFFYVELS